jgi:hypothetical protein
VKTSENGLFLYKSLQGPALVKSRFTDYFMVLFSAGWLLGLSPLLLMPVGVAMLSMPRKLTSVNYFTFHAELLPHTEQVVFHKATLFGNMKRVYVNIKNLEKIDAEILPSKNIDIV